MGKAGDVTAALKIADSSGDETGTSTYYKIAEVQSEGGDIAGAQATARLIRDPYYAVIARVDIAKALVESGDIARAKITLGTAQEATAQFREEDQNRARTAIAEVEAKLATTNVPASVDQSTQDPVSGWLHELGIYNAYGSQPAMVISRDLNTSVFLDLAAHLKSLNASLKSQVEHENLSAIYFRRSEPQIIFDNLRETASALVGEQNTIHRMLKRQGMR
jgi:hypothetical protein